MTFNPPLPFDPLNQTDYEPWYDMINSIVGFVTASTHLASTLRKSHCCFPDRLEITEVFSDKERGNDQVFEITDFPWFLKELTKAPYIFRSIPLIQFPLCGIMQGEPSTEPRSIALIDTRDFGDVNYENNNNYPIISDTHLAAFKRPESPKSEASNQSCFFEEYTDSNQTIDSSNLQENYEQIEKTEQNNISQNGSLNKLLNRSSNIKMKNSFPYLTDLNKNEENICNMYITGDVPSVHEDLFLECHVEEILIVEKQSESKVIKVENKEEGVSTNEDLLGVAKIAKYYSIENISSKQSNKNYTNSERKIIPDNIEPKLEERCLTDESDREKLNCTFDGNLSLNTGEDKNNKEEVRTVENKQNPENAHIRNLERGNGTKKLENKINGGKKNKKIKHKTKKIITEKAENIIPITNKSVPFYNLLENLHTNSVEGSYVESDDTENPELPDMKEMKLLVSQEAKKNTNKCIRKKMNSTTMKQNTQNLKEDTGKDSVNFISKNIAHCLNAKKKSITDATRNEKSDINIRSKRPLKGRIGVANVLTTSSPTNINIRVSTILRRKPKLSDQKPLMENTVKMIHQTEIALPLKGNNETRKLTVKKSANRSRPLSTKPSRNEDVHKILDRLPEIKSCLKSGQKYKNGSPKICVINEEHSLSYNKKTPNIIGNSNSKIIRKLPISKETTLKLMAAETVKKASELLRTSTEVLQPTTTMRRTVVSESVRAAPSRSKKR